MKFVRPLSQIESCVTRKLNRTFSLSGVGCDRLQLPLSDLPALVSKWWPLDPSTVASTIAPTLHVTAAPDGGAARGIGAREQVLSALHREAVQVDVGSLHSYLTSNIEDALPGGAALPPAVFSRLSKFVLAAERSGSLRRHLSDARPAAVARFLRTYAVSRRATDGERYAAMLVAQHTAALLVGVDAANLEAVPLFARMPLSPRDVESLLEAARLFKCLSVPLASILAGHAVVFMRAASSGSNASILSPIELRRLLYAAVDTRNAGASYIGLVAAAARVVLAVAMHEPDALWSAATAPAVIAFIYDAVVVGRTSLPALVETLAATATLRAVDTLSPTQLVCFITAASAGCGAAQSPRATLALRNAFRVVLTSAAGRPAAPRRMEALVGGRPSSSLSPRQHVLLLHSAAVGGHIDGNELAVDTLMRRLRDGLVRHGVLARPHPQQREQDGGAHDTAIDVSIPSATEATGVASRLLTALDGVAILPTMLLQLESIVSAHNYRASAMNVHAVSQQQQQVTPLFARESSTSLGAFGDNNAYASANNGGSDPNHRPGREDARPSVDGRSSPAVNSAGSSEPPTSPFGPNPARAPNGVFVLGRRAREVIAASVKQQAAAGCIMSDAPGVQRWLDAVFTRQTPRRVNDSVSPLPQVPLPNGISITASSPVATAASRAAVESNGGEATSIAHPRRTSRSLVSLVLARAFCEAAAHLGAPQPELGLVLETGAIVDVAWTALGLGFVFAEPDVHLALSAEEQAAALDLAVAAAVESPASLVGQRGDHGYGRVVKTTGGAVMSSEFDQWQPPTTLTSDVTRTWQSTAARAAAIGVPYIHAVVDTESFAPRTCAHEVTPAALAEASLASRARVRCYFVRAPEWAVLVPLLTQLRSASAVPAERSGNVDSERVTLQRELRDAALRIAKFKIWSFRVVRAAERVATGRQPLHAGGLRGSSQWIRRDASPTHRI